MKVRSKILLGLFLFTVAVIAGCNKKSDDNVGNGYFSVGSTSYPLFTGFLVNNGHWGSATAYSYDLSLLTRDFYLYVTDDVIDSIRGHGQMLHFKFYASDSLSLNPEVYVYDAEQLGTAGTFTNGNVFFNFYPVSLRYDSIRQITSGQITILKNGNDYQLSFEGKDERGQNLTGYYEGSFYLGNSVKKAFKTIYHSR
ncbi:MAG TPA: hypothetical protein PKL64_09120 [Bacteroidales bacterium]|nr:hypothetical protein [Bacteroidales bacterium]